MKADDIKAKDAWRQHMSKLPMIEKMAVIASIQRLANNIRKTTGRPLKPQWEIESAAK